jgi:hypothetical protein
MRTIAAPAATAVRSAFLQLHLSAPSYMVVLSPFFISLPPVILSRAIPGRRQDGAPARRSPSRRPEEPGEEDLPPRPQPHRPLQDLVASSQAPPALARQSGGLRGGGSDARTGEELDRGGACRREEVEAVASPPKIRSRDLAPDATTEAVALRKLTRSPSPPWSSLPCRVEPTNASPTSRPRSHSPTSRTHTHHFFNVQTTAPAPDRILIY